jgi:hypothetical protein
MSATLPNELDEASERSRPPTFDLISSDENSATPENELNETFPIEFAINELQNEQQRQQQTATHTTHQSSTESNNATTSGTVAVTERLAADDNLTLGIASKYEMVKKAIIIIKQNASIHYYRINNNLFYIRQQFVLLLEPYDLVVAVAQLRRG